MIEHYLINFVIATVGMVGLLYAIYFYLKHNPQLGGMAAFKPLQNQRQLQVKSVLNLEPRKRLYVVGYGPQQFLIATTMDKTELLATLETEPPTEETSDAMAEPPAEVEASSAPQIVDPREEGFWGCLRYSFKLAFADRFYRSGGK